MTIALNQTHDPGIRSRVASANADGTDFPLQNLPFGVFRRRDHTDTARVGVAIGDQIFDVAAAHRAGLFTGLAANAADACAAPALNGLMALGGEHWTALRGALHQMLRDDTENATIESLSGMLLSMDEAELLLPALVGDYTDFYASIDHATNVGRLFRPDNPLLPNYKYVPIGYHGRASSLVVSGTAVRRPQGQTKDPDADEPRFGPSKLLDYELEVGIFVGPGNLQGAALPIGSADRHIFGLCLVNDWSARDIQSWEYQPLGPFLSKSFATSVSPWVVTLEALAPFRRAALQRPPGDPASLPYLRDDGDQAHGGFDLTLEVAISTAAMRHAGRAPQRLSHGSFADMYWTISQLLTHHASNGCNLRPGDLLASGTVSGPTPAARGCLLELTTRGRDPIELPDGEQRRFLQDGDEVILRGWCERSGAARIGFGECRGVVLPPLDQV